MKNTKLLRLESLENRQMLSADGMLTADVAVANDAEVVVAENAEDVVDVQPAPVANKAGWETETTINVKYSDASYVAGEESYVVEYSKTDDFAVVEGSKTFSRPGVGTIRNLDPGTTYYFRVKSVSAEGESDWSNTVSATTVGVDVAAPVAVKAGWETTTTINIKYADEAFVRGENSYVVEYSKTDDFAVVEGSKAFTQPGVGTIRNLDPGTTYFFRVKSVLCDGTAESDWSNIVSCATVALPQLTTPVAVKAGWETATSINLKYTDDAFVRGENTYVVEYSLTEDFAVVEGSKAFTQPGIGRIGNLQSGTTYYFRVKAVGENYADSEWSNVVSWSTLAAEELI